MRVRVPAVRVAVGIGLASYGAWAALYALGLVRPDAGRALALYWPVLVALWGALGALDRVVARRAPSVGSLLLVAAGIALLARNAGWIGVDAWSLVGAAVAVALGLAIAFGGRAMVIVDEGWGAFGRSGRWWHRRRGGTAWVGSTHIRAEGEGPWELDDRVYRQAVGDLRLDLSRARLREGETRLVVEGGVGEILVLVPAEMPVHLAARVQVGEIRLFDLEASGFERFLEYESEGYAAAPRRLRIDLSMRLGDIAVERVV